MNMDNTQDEHADRRLAPVAGYAACDWPEDSADENGNYQNECVQCKCKFIGHKRRHVCKVCDAKNRETWAAMSEEERQEVRRKREAEFVHWMMGQRHTDKDVKPRERQ